MSDDEPDWATEREKLHGPKRMAALRIKSIINDLADPSVEFMRIEPDAFMNLPDAIEDVLQAYKDAVKLGAPVDVRKRYLLWIECAVKMLRACAG